MKPAFEVAHPLLVHSLVLKQENAYIFSERLTL